jgi:acetoin utilization deacetylase AcuC-like enzyme
MPIKAVYSNEYGIDLGLHVFPTEKYRLVYQQLDARGLVPRITWYEPQAVSWDDLARVHAREYLEQARTGAFSPAELAQLELPWSVQIVGGFRLMCGGTITAAALAAGDASAPVVHLGGGFHHAFPAHGEGFCLFNDVAVAIRVLQDRGAIARAAVVDLDVHHGNGTAFTFETDPTVFTCSVHQQHNYPAFKPRGSLDIGLPDGTTGEQYQAAVDRALAEIGRFGPDLVIYLAGADPFEHDRLGGLGLTKNALRARDRRVFDWCRRANVPVATMLAGGYAYDTADTVDIHVATVEEALGAGFGIGAELS